VDDVPNGNQYKTYSVYTGAEEKQGLYGAALAQALKDKLGPVGALTALAAGAPMVVSVTYHDGSQEVFVHMPGATSSTEGNYEVPGSEHDSSGNALCLNFGPGRSRWRRRWFFRWRRFGRGYRFIALRQGQRDCGQRRNRIIRVLLDRLSSSWSLLQLTPHGNQQITTWGHNLGHPEFVVRENTIIFSNLDIVFASPWVKKTCADAVLARRTFFSKPSA